MGSILIFCKTLLKGGAEKQALILARLITEKKTDVIVVNWSGDKIDMANLQFINDNSIKYIGLNGNPISKLIQFLRIIKNEKITIILSYLTLPNFIAGISRLFYRELFSMGGIRTEKLPLYKFVFEKLVHNYLNDITVFNNYSAKGKFVKRGFNQDKIRVIHNAIHSSFLTINEIPGNAINIVSVFRFVGSKDFKTALHAFSILKEKNKDKNFKYYIAGYGPLESQIRELVASLKLENEVTILINPPNIPDILAKCDIYLSTSLFEGLSNSIMEAMVAGLPVIATNVGDNPYLVKDGFNGFLVECGDFNSIAEKLGYLSNTNNVRMEFGKNSQLIIKEEFSEERFIGNYFKLFSEKTHRENKSDLVSV
jgi:glycosyltransferase involved in cell wall biosynthesis